MVGVTVLIETVAHEFAANYLFDTRGLFPFFAADRRVKDGGGSQKSTFTYEGESWQVKLYYQDSGLKHPGSTTPEGTPFDLDTLREFLLTVRSADNPIG